MSDAVDLQEPDGKTATLKVDNLAKSFDSKTVLDDVSFSVKKGEILGCLGRTAREKQQ